MATYLLDHGVSMEEPRPIDYMHDSTATTPLQTAAKMSCLDIVQLLVARGAVTHQHEFSVPNGADGDLVAGYLQQHGSKPVKRV
jgi:ankyrin repeat protein